MGQYVGRSREGGTLMYIEVYDKKTKEYIGIKNLHHSATEEEQWAAALSVAQLTGTRTHKRMRSTSEAKDSLIMEVKGTKGA